MGFMKKVKEAAGSVAEGAKKGTAQVQGKIEQGQTRKKADELARQLGYLIAKERTEGVPAGAEADRLASEIAALEAQLAGEESAEGMATMAPEPGTATPAASEAVAPPPTSASEPTPGDFKLD